MGFTWDPTERADFDAALEAHIRAVFPGAQLTWSEAHRRLTIARAGGAVRQIWEPNFFFSWPSFSREHLFAQVCAHIAAEDA